MTLELSTIERWIDEQIVCRFLEYDTLDLIYKEIVICVDIENPDSLNINIHIAVLNYKTNKSQPKEIKTHVSSYYHIDAENNANITNQESFETRSQYQNQND